MKELIIQKLQEVIDPELGINVYDLGLIYRIEADDQEVALTMTLTTRGCPLHDSITSGVRHAIGSIPTVKRVHIELVWEPAWDPSRMSAAAKAVLGHR